DGSGGRVADGDGHQRADRDGRSGRSGCRGTGLRGHVLRQQAEQLADSALSGRLCGYGPRVSRDVRLGRTELGVEDLSPGDAGDDLAGDRTELRDLLEPVAQLLEAAGERGDGADVADAQMGDQAGGVGGRI